MSSFLFGDFVVLCDLDAHDYDLEDPVNGQIGVVVSSTKDQPTTPPQYLVRLAHREPTLFADLECSGGSATPVVEFRENVNVVEMDHKQSSSSQERTKTIGGGADSSQETKTVEGVLTRTSSEVRKVEMLKMLEDLEGENSAIGGDDISTSEADESSTGATKELTPTRRQDSANVDPVLVPSASTSVSVRPPAAQIRPAVLTCRAPTRVVDNLAVWVDGRNLRKVSSLQMRLHTQTFYGYVEIDDNTCGAAMLAGAYICCNKVNRLSWWWVHESGGEEEGRWGGVEERGTISHESWRHNHEWGFTLLQHACTTPVGGSEPIPWRSGLNTTPRRRIFDPPGTRSPHPR